MAANATALEEAAFIASEFIYSIDNLPHEVSHLLQEIKHRDTKAQELQQEIDKDSARYIRHSLRASASPLTDAPSPKSGALPAKIAAAFAEIQVLSTEKQQLAERLVEVVQRTQTRLDVELIKVRTLQGETVEYSPVVGKPLAALAAGSESFKHPIASITESLRNALAPASPALEARQAAPALEVAASPTASSASSYKRRKVTASGPSIKVPARSASPKEQVTASQSTHQRSRLSRQIHPPVKEDEDEMDLDEDAEGDGDDGDGDDRLYCYCQKQSYGDMIACDNEGSCPYEWFHLSCAGIKGPTPERWYCDACKDKVAAAQPARKGRKK